MAANDPTALIPAARQGDPCARAELIGHYRSYLRLLARLEVRPLLQAKFDESDLVQETCLQAIQSMDQFEGSDEAQLTNWLRRILANKGAWMARKYLGTEKRDVRLEQRLQTNLDQSSRNLATMLSMGGSSPSKSAIRRERSVRLAEAIAEVQGAQREVLIMHGLEGTSVADVAKSMGRTEESTWKLWARGLQSLRKIVGDLS
jgi:RNA polymerase sigma-70 factor (ECF subfamily)